MNTPGNYKTIFNAADIQLYLDGQMSAMDMHQLEKAAMEDPFLADAIEGYRNKQSRGEKDTTADLHELQGRLENKKAIPSKKTIALFPQQLFKIAVILILIAGPAILAYLFVNNNKNAKTAIVTNDKVEQEIYQPPTGNLDTISIADLAKREITVVSSNDKSRKSLPIKIKELPQSTFPSPSIDKEVPTATNIASAPLVAKNETAARSNQSLQKQSTLFEVNQQPDRFTVYKGKVVDGGKMPIANASVSLLSEPGHLSVTTDTGGYFQIATRDSVASIVINGVGYQTVQTQLQNITPGVEIILKPAGNKLEEMVVVGYGAKKRKAIKVTSADVQPVPGFPVFYEYINKNKKVDSLSRGNVDVSFFINNKGRPDKFIIEKSLSTARDQEAIRLIKDGPAWKVLNSKKTKTKLTIQF